MTAMLLGYFSRYKDQSNGWTIENTANKGRNLGFSPEGSHRPSKAPSLLLGTVSPSAGAKRLGFEAGLSPPSGGKVKEKYRYTFTPLYLHGLQTDIFTSTLPCWCLLVSIVTDVKLDTKKSRQVHTNFLRSIFCMLTITNTVSVQNYEALTGELNTNKSVLKQ